MGPSADSSRRGVGNGSCVTVGSVTTWVHLACSTWESQLHISCPSVTGLTFSFPVSYPCLLPTTGTCWKCSTSCSEQTGAGSLAWCVVMLQSTGAALLALPSCLVPKEPEGCLWLLTSLFFRVRVLWFPIDYSIYVITIETTGISSLIGCKLEIYWLGRIPNEWD